MNLHDLVSGCLGTGTRGEEGDSLTHAQVLEVLVHNLVVSPVPLYRLADWIAPLEASAFGLTESQKKRLNDDRVGRTLEALASVRGRSLFFRLALRMLKEFQLQTHRIHFDTTSVTFHGNYAASVAEPVISRGYNKDHRPDLKQLLFGLNVTADGAVPLLHRLHSGNRTDDTLHPSNVEALWRLLGREDFIYVADSKLCTKRNLALIDNANGKFVTVLPRSRKEDKRFRQHLREKGVRWRFLMARPSTRRASDPPTRYYTCKAPIEQTEDGYRLGWIRSSEKVRRDRQARKAALTKALTALETLSQRLNQGKLKRAAAIGNAVRAILSEHGVSEFLEVRVRWTIKIETRYLRRGRPKRGEAGRQVRTRTFFLETRRRKERLDAEARTDGVFPIVSNLGRDHGKRKLLTIYKYQPYVEKRFSALKSELWVTPAFLKKPARVAGMLHAYFVALAASGLIERTVRLNMERTGLAELPLFPEGRTTQTPTCPRALEAFTALTWYEFEQGDQHVCFALKLDKLQRDLLRLLEVPKEVYR